MQSHHSLASDFPSLSIPSRGTVRAFGKPFVAQRLGWSTTPSADFCHALKAGFPAFSRCRFRVGDTGQISRGKTRILPRIDAGFTTCSPFADGGLGGHVPTGPGCTSLAGRSGARRACPSPVTNSPQDCLCTGSASYPVFVHRPAISPWACLPHPASRRRTCPLANLRLCEYLVSGLSPDWTRAMHGTHVQSNRRGAASSRSVRVD